MSLQLVDGLLQLVEVLLCTLPAILHGFVAVLRSRGGVLLCLGEQFVGFLVGLGILGLGCIGSLYLPAEGLHRVDFLDVKLLSLFPDVRLAGLDVVLDSGGADGHRLVLQVFESDYLHADIEGTKHAVAALVDVVLHGTDDLDGTSCYVEGTKRGDAEEQFLPAGHVIDSCAHGLEILPSDLFQIVAGHEGMTIGLSLKAFQHMVMGVEDGLDTAFVESVVVVLIEGVNMQAQIIDHRGQSVAEACGVDITIQLFESLKRLVLLLLPFEHVGRRLERRLGLRQQRDVTYSHALLLANLAAQLELGIESVRGIEHTIATP